MIREKTVGILNYCIEAGVKGILCFGFGVTLREGDREYYYSKLDEHFPGIKEKYQHKYGNAYEVMSENNPALSRTFSKYVILITSCPIPGRYSVI